MCTGGGSLLKGQVPRIDHADAVPRGEPYSSIRGLCHMRAEAAINPNASHSVGQVENRSFDDVPRIIRPRIPFRTFNPNEAAGHVDPDIMVVVLHRPMDLVAGKAVLAVEGFN